MQKVVRLHNPVIEFDKVKTSRFDALLVALDGQHFVDRKVASDIAQELDVAKFQQPIGIVQEQCRRIDAETPAVEIDEAIELGQDVGEIVPNFFEGKHGTGTRATGRIADHHRAAAAERDWTVSEALERSEHHDAEHVPDVQGPRSRVEPDIGRHNPLLEGAAEQVGVGDILQIPTVLQVVERVDSRLTRELRGRQSGRGGGLILSGHRIAVSPFKRKKVRPPG